MSMTAEAISKVIREIQEEQKADEEVSKMSMTLDDCKWGELEPGPENRERYLLDKATMSLNDSLKQVRNCVDVIAVNWYEGKLDIHCNWRSLIKLFDVDEFEVVDHGDDTKRFVCKYNGIELFFLADSDRMMEMVKMEYCTGAEIAEALEVA